MSDSHTARLESALAGRYKIRRKLGEGGMASVYLAEDVKHERNVALKILKPELAAVIGAERFLAEIKTTANLQHPHILALFDSGEADGFLYYVMPFIEGETLRERLDRERQLGVDEAVRIAREVADALDYAHRNDVIHRDIKPGNILLHDGRPVVADFGIALAISAAGGGRMTETGLSLGTPHYMSPEQASADRDLSARSDVYSLGCVLYEMIAGQPPHTGPSAQSVLVRILTETPRPLTEMRHTVPPHVAATVAKSIEKLPADRFDSARDFMEALEDEGFTYVAVPRAAKPAAQQPPVPVAPGAGRRSGWLPLAATGVITAVMGIAVGLRMGDTDPALAPRAVFPFETDTSYQATMMCCGASHAVSPDGTRLAHLGIAGGRRTIFVRALDQLVAQPVRGSEGGRHPVFSTDGTWLAFNTGADLMKVPTEGGQPMTVASGVGTLRGIHWMPDNTVVFAGDQNGDGLMRVSADGGEPEVLTVPDSAAGERAHRYPHALPGGEVVLFSVMPWDRAEVPRVDALDLRSGTRTPILRGSSVWYVETGHLVYGMPDGSVMSQRFHAQRLDTLGGPSRVAESVVYRVEGLLDFGVSRNGTMFTVHGQVSGQNRLVLVSRDGVEEPIPLDGPFRSPRFSPDGRQIAVELEGEADGSTDDIWLWDLELRNGTRITTEGDNSLPSWTADGQSVLFQREGGETGGELWQRRVDGTGAAQRVQGGPIWESDHSADGAWLVWSTTVGAGVDADILAREWADTAGVRTLLASEFTERTPALSPDGRWLAYISNVSGEPEAYVRSFPDMGPLTKISADRAVEPRWAPGGESVLYIDTGSDMLMEVAVRVESGRLVPGERRQVIQTAPYATAGIVTNWDVHPDGDRLVFVRGGTTFTQQRLVTLNATSPAGRR
jgi:serine/threonine-protein kinase